MECRRCVTVVRRMPREAKVGGAGAGSGKPRWPRSCSQSELRDERDEAGARGGLSFERLQGEAVRTAATLWRWAIRVPEPCDERRRCGATLRKRGTWRLKAAFGRAQFAGIGSPSSSQSLRNPAATSARRVVSTSE